MARQSTESEFRICRQSVQQAAEKINEPIDACVQVGGEERARQHNMRHMGRKVSAISLRSI